MRDLQAELMTTMAENVPFKQLVIQAKRAIKEYEETYSNDREQFLIFVMQIDMMSHIMNISSKNAKDMLTDLDKTDKLMSLFKDNNN